MPTHKSLLELVMKPAFLPNPNPSSGREKQNDLHLKATPKHLSGLEKEEGKF